MGVKTVGWGGADVVKVMGGGAGVKVMGGVTDGHDGGDDGGGVMMKMVECGRKWWKPCQYW